MAGQDVSMNQGCAKVSPRWQAIDHHPCSGKCSSRAMQSPQRGGRTSSRKVVSSHDSARACFGISKLRSGCRARNDAACTTCKSARSCCTAEEGAEEGAEEASPRLTRTQRSEQDTKSYDMLRSPARWHLQATAGWRERVPLLRSTIWISSDRLRVDCKEHQPGRRRPADRGARARARRAGSSGPPSAQGATRSLAGRCRTAAAASPARPAQT